MIELDPTMNVLWRNALAAIPVALIVMAICRWVPCRASTRHALWLLVLAVLLLPPVEAKLSGVHRAATALGAAATQSEGTFLASATDPAPVAEPPPATERSCDVEGLHVHRDDVPTWPSLQEPAGGLESGAAAIGRRRPPQALRRAPGSAELLSRSDEAPNGVTTHAARSDAPARAAEPSPSSTPAPAPVADRPGALEQVAAAATTPPASGRAAIVASAAAMQQTTQWLRQLREVVTALPPVPPVVWIGGLVVIAFVSTVRIVVAARTLRHAERAPDDVQHLVAEAARRIGLRNVPPAMMVDLPVSPMVWCGRRTRLVLPRRLWNELDATGRNAVILHELAHLKRRDHWVCRILALLTIVYWWHPVAWIASRRLDEEADFCCDAWVTSLLPGERRAYAQAILDTKSYISNSRRPAPSLALGVTSGGARRLSRRLTMVLTEHARPRLSIRGLALAGVLATLTWLATPMWACPPNENAAQKRELREAARALERDAAIRFNQRGPTSRPSRAVAATQPDSQPATAPAEETPDVTTFERYMQDRNTTDDDLEGRIDELERLLEELSDQLHQMRPDHPAPSAMSRPSLYGTAQYDDCTADRVAALRSFLNNHHDDCTPNRVQVIRSYAGYDDCAPNRAYTITYNDGGCGDPVVTYANGATLNNVYSVNSFPQDGDLVVRFYELSPGKLDALSDLMIREDVPILVSPQEGGIEVHATMPHHMIFEAFVTMIEAEQEVVGYALPRGKLEALSNLMIRQDVPTLVDPQRDQIVVHGDGLEQLIFKAFVDMIHPRDGQNQQLMEATERIRARQHEMNQRIDAAIRQQMDAIQTQMDATMRQSETALERAVALEMQANDMAVEAEAFEDAADELFDEVENIRDHAEELSDRARDVAMREADVVEHEAERTLRRAEALEDHADQLEDQADQWEDRADVLGDQIEELEDRLEELIESIQERFDEAQTLR